MELSLALRKLQFVVNAGDYRQNSYIRRAKSLDMFVVGVKSSVRMWGYSRSSADRRCSNYIWVINDFIAN